MPIYALGERVPTIDALAYVHPDAVIIGDVRIGPESSIWPSAVLRGDSGYIQVGSRSSIQDGTIVHCTAVFPTVVGDDCVVGHNAHLEGCTIESGSLVGSGSVVLHGVTVRSGALVGAHALVPNGMEVPSNAMALGVPAKLRLDSVDPGMIARSAAKYVQNGRWYREQLRRID
jgi:carbonic anhydrase/acetyltransferase-like protein (isoleucine patch superfamily)